MATQEKNMLSYTLDNDVIAYTFNICRHGYVFEIFFVTQQIYIESCKITGRQTKLNALRMLSRIEAIQKRTPNYLAKNVHIYKYRISSIKY